MRYSLPRLYLLYVNREPGVALLPIGALLGLAVTAFALKFLASSADFLVRSVRADAVVVGKQLVARDLDQLHAPGALFAHGGKRQPRWTVQVAFADATGAARQGTISLSRSDGEPLQPGDPLPVLYDPQNPQTVRAVNTWWDPVMLLPVLALGIAIAGVCGFLFVGQLRELRERVRLVRTGDAVPGRIASAVVEGRGRGKSASVSVIVYEFASSAGEVQRGTVELAGKLPPGIATGGAAVVLLDPDDDTRHALDVFDARRDDRLRLFG